MAIFKCKMCGGALEVNNESVAVCEYCGTQQTLPKLNDDRKANLYDRANHFRRNNEFDKAMSIYENILNEDKTDAESYWSIVLCRYGVEYVEDPATRKRVPTVNRAQFTSVFDDDNYKSALQYADSVQKSIYEAEAKAINEIQKGILEISQKEEPFDVFICYKETDNNGRRTPDSVLATELYHELIKEGFKVFFSRITLEDKLGTAYEPYIFAALNSAKVMVVLGTKQEYFNAVWVKNEWSRYLALIKQGQKKMLIPAYKDMDPYDLPEEFSHLQAQDMSKLGFMQDLVRGITKITAANKPEPTTVKETIITNDASGNATALLKRGFMALEDGEWAKADNFFEQCLNQNAELAEAYLGKLMAECKVRTRNELANCALPFDGNPHYKKTIRFGDNELKADLEGYVTYINERNERNRLEGIYNQAFSAMSSATTEAMFKQAAGIFRSISGYKDSDKLAADCLAKAEEKRIEAEHNRLEIVYNHALAIMSRATTAGEFEQASEDFKSIAGYKDSAELAKECCEKAYDVIYASACEILDDSHTWHGKKSDINAHEEAIQKFISLNGWRDSEEKILLCQKRIADAKAKAEADRIESERRAIAARKEAERKAKRQKRIGIIVVFAICAVITFVIFLNSVIIPNSKYNNALKLAEAGNYDQAIAIFTELGDYKDAEDKIKEANYQKAVELAGKSDFANAAIAYGKAGNYKDAKEKSFALWDKIAVRETVSAGDSHTVGLKSDGTVVAVGDNDSGQCNVGGWSDRVAVSAGDDYTVCLKSNGMVVAVGGNVNGQFWTDIVAISANRYHTVGLKSDGTVVAVGSDYDGQCNVGGWTDIVAVSAGLNHTVGLKSDGTVVAVGSDYDGQCNVGGWTDIVAVSAGDSHTVGLKSDGTVVAVGNNEYGECDVSGWTDIVAVSVGYYHTVGLKSNGTVVAVGSNFYGQCDVSGWNDIVAVSAGYDHTVGLKNDGTVVTAGSNASGQCDVSGWTDIKLYE